MLSIVVTIYNGEPYIERCLNAIFKQTFKDYEVICVDDGSTDNSYQLLNKFKRQNMKVIRTENRGVWYARKEGIRMAGGDWIGFVDCDDAIMQDMYSDMMERVVKQPDIDMVVCGFRKVDALSEKVFSVQMVGFGDRIIDVKTNKEILAAVNPSMCNKIFRTHLVRHSIELEQAPRIMEDLILIGSIFPLLHNVAFCSRPYYLYYDNRGSATKSISVKDLDHAKSAILSLKQYYENVAKENRDLLDLLAVVHVGVAFTININHYKKEESVYSVWQNVLNFLDTDFSGWRRNALVSVVHSIRWRQLGKVYLIYNLFRTKLYLAFVWIYHVAVIKLKIDIRW